MPERLKFSATGLLSAALWLAASLGAAAATVTPMVSVGDLHLLALRSDGAVLSWGANAHGQLGFGRQTFQARPGQVAGLSGVQRVGVGDNHSLALRSDGSLWAWGANDSGQLGDGSTSDRARPVLIAGLGKVAMACGGGQYSMALAQDGTVWAWGDNSTGVLTDAAPGSSPIPLRLAGLDAIASLACGSRHALALGRDGTVWAWGDNSQGALGDGSLTSQRKPARIAGLTQVQAVVAGNDFSAALMQDGTVQEWGVQNPYADPKGTPRSRPATTHGLSGIQAIAASQGSYALLALRNDASSRSDWWRWITGSAPEAQATVGALSAVASGYGQDLLLMQDQSVLAYGFNGNTFGNLGDGSTAYRQEPGPVLDLRGIVQVTTGVWHSLALDGNGTVWSWGLDNSGQLGQDRTLSHATPTLLLGLNPMLQVAAGHRHSLALDQSGAVWAWGSNGYAQLGDASWVDSATPIRLSAITGVQAVAAGGLYSLALKSDGTLWQWGVGLPGAGVVDSSLPTQVVQNSVAMAAGAAHVLALQRDGSVKAWGVNSEGQLGDGSRVDASQVLSVPGLTGVTKLVASRASSYALLGDGTLRAWGSNALGQLGDGSTTDRLTPVPVPGLREVVDIAAGSEHALAQTRDGSIWGWGLAASPVLGRLSEPTTTPTRLSPPTLAAPTRLVAGAASSAVLAADGLLLSTGDNGFGQLGDGTFAQRPDWVLAINPEANGFLDLAPGRTKTIAPALLPPFLVKTDKRGDLAALSLRADVRGLLDAALLQAARSRRAAARYNLYVAALTGIGGTLNWYQLNNARHWNQLNWPMAEYLGGVSLSGASDSVLVRILDDVDVSTWGDLRIFVGYGTDADDMLVSQRFREILTLTPASVR